ncbi:hypothetical protein OO012_06945 [Rhodobacteraceae bacterium KMM 6894]|nr:hypothetical protein [Rhodobacteraceae bacterium KMM 6894]
MRHVQAARSIPDDGFGPVLSACTTNCREMRETSDILFKVTIGAGPNGSTACLA